MKNDEKSSMSAEEFWQRVNLLLKNKGIKQADFSINCGFQKDRVNNWSAKKTLPNVFEAYTIAKNLDVSLDYLITGNDEKKVTEARDKAVDAIELLKSIINSSN